MFNQSGSNVRSNTNKAWREDTRDVKFGIQIGSDRPPNATNLGLFNISFSTFWLTESHVLKMILKRSRFVPFGANLIQFGCQI